MRRETELHTPAHDGRGLQAGCYLTIDSVVKEHFIGLCYGSEASTSSPLQNSVTITLPFVLFPAENRPFRSQIYGGFYGFLLVFIRKLGQILSALGFPAKKFALPIGKKTN
jgi:hypothetical protein